MPAQAVSLKLEAAEEARSLQLELLDALRAAQALEKKEAERVRRELDEAVSAAGAATESAADQKKVIRPSPWSTRLGLTRHVSFSLVSLASPTPSSPIPIHASSAADYPKPSLPPSSLPFPLASKLPCRLCLERAWRPKGILSPAPGW